MKNSIIKIPFILLLLMAVNVKGQLLKQGSIVATHRDGYFNGNNLNTAVVVVLDASNTTGIPPTSVSSMFSSTVPNRYVWTNSAAMTNPKPNWITGIGTNHWDYAKLGAVFGITLDYVGNGNIYVSNSSIYSGESTSKHDAVYKIDGTSGAVNQIINLSGTDPTKGIGNLKYFTNAGTNYIAFTWWESGGIYIYEENALGAWVQHSSFIPKFGNSASNSSIVPYGIAVRNTATGLRIFYGEFNSSVTSTTSTKVFSIPLTATATFSSSAIEQLEFNIPVTKYYSGAADLVSISDIAFSKDNNRILLAQQSLSSTYSLGAHNSIVQEYEDLGTWSAIGKYPSGYNASVLTGASTTTQSSYNNSHNAVGGVSYFNNILFTDGNNNPGNIKCDTTVLYTSDQIYFTNNAPIDAAENISNFGSTPGGPYIYGIQGLPSKNAFVNNLDAFCFSLKINETIINAMDKFHLGDVEAYNPPLNCTPVQNCNCGLWNNILLGNSTWWTGSTAPIPTLTFNQGQSSGVLFPNYSCQGNNCGTAQIQYELLNATYTVLQSAVANVGIDLSNTNIKNLPCGNYTIRLIPRCGNTPCSAISIPLIITCPAPGICDCKGTVTITASQQGLTVTPQNNTSTANPVSTVTGSFTLSASLPVTEVRMLVEEFRLTTTTGNENCQLCKNKPQSWASINAATLSGVTSQTAVSPTLSNDIREFVFNNGANTMFNLSGNTMNFTLGVPGITGLNCCKLKAEVCIKFIIRDVNCCEREVLKCFTFDLQ